MGSDKTRENVTCEGVLFTGLARLGSARCGSVRFGSASGVWCVGCGWWLCGFCVWCAVWLSLGYLPRSNDRDNQTTNQPPKTTVKPQRLQATTVTCGFQL